MDKSIQRRFSHGRWFTVLVGVVLLVIVFFTMLNLSGTWELGDFRVTFYRTARYFLHGKNIYRNEYPHPTNGNEYPPFNPIWGLYFFVPLGAFALPEAEALRVVLDIAGISFFAYLSARWARIPNPLTSVLLLFAPWLLTQIHSGQLIPLVFLGILLCYWGVSKPSALITAVGLWLILTKFIIVSLVVLATVLFAWRQRILKQTLLILIGLIGVSSIAQPFWFIDLAMLYHDRLLNPRPADSMLLVPAYPWGQGLVLLTGALFLIGYVRFENPVHPSRWLWLIMIGTSLVGALHTYIYDWQLLMPLLAWLARVRWGIAATLGVYVYMLTWVFLRQDLNLPLPSSRIVPSLVLTLVLIGGLVSPKLAVEREMAKDA